MQTRETNTYTLLEAQDIYATTDFRGPPAIAQRETYARPRTEFHDFLVLCPQLDLISEALPAELANRIGQSCERNMPQK